MSECAICIETFSVPEELSALTCGHCFHGACIEEWAKTRTPVSNSNSNAPRIPASQTCPSCRAPFTIVSPSHGIVRKLLLSGLILVKIDQVEVWTRDAENAADFQARARQAEREVARERADNDALRADLSVILDSKLGLANELSRKEEALKEKDAVLKEKEAELEVYKNESESLKNECAKKDTEILEARSRIQETEEGLVRKDQEILIASNRIQETQVKNQEKLTKMEEDLRQQQEIVENLKKVYDDKVVSEAATEKLLVECRSKLREMESFAREKKEESDERFGELQDECLSKMIRLDQIEDRFVSEAKRQENVVQELRDALIESQRLRESADQKVNAMKDAMKDLVEAFTQDDSKEAPKSCLLGQEKDDDDSIEVIDEGADCGGGTDLFYEAEEDDDKLRENGAVEREDAEGSSRLHTADAIAEGRVPRYDSPSVVVCPVDSRGSGRNANSRKRDADFVCEMERELARGSNVSSTPRPKVSSSSLAEFPILLESLKGNSASSSSDLDSVSELLASGFHSPSYDHYVREVIKELQPQLKLILFSQVPAFDEGEGVGDVRVSRLCSALKLTAYLLLSRAQIAESLVGELGLLHILTRFLRFDVQRSKLMALSLLKIVATRPAFNFEVPALSVSLVNSLFRDSPSVERAVASLTHGISQGRGFFRWRPVLVQVSRVDRLKEDAKEFILGVVQADKGLPMVEQEMTGNC